jgi:protocatechuate 3,4-dioxygenase beta subunit
MGEVTGGLGTTNDILGPFTLRRSSYSFPNLYEDLGNKIFLKGRVFKSDWHTPLKDALVEIWHCNTEGRWRYVTVQRLTNKNMENNAEGMLLKPFCQEENT